MAANRLYYKLKPYLPWRLRMGLRRIIACRQRKAHQDVWPINQAAGNPPAGWPGWPQGKKFALVLTHDVEGPAGLAKCQQLMRLEQALGFRSSFNFIPEGPYTVSRELREELRQNGFEVGVHDLRHDGKLYWRREEFPENARSINRYLKEWGACGFRSGFMLFDREGLHDLNILYDASTFDTDPFEPQPDGAGTIFPFWIARPESAKNETENDKSGMVNGRPVSAASFTPHHPTLGSGYVELPYTLPQDSTMFFVLREKSPAIWKKKLDWIVERGGMALVNVHPDYVGFNERKLRNVEFPASWYQEFLQYVKNRYGDDLWHALPREVAGWYQENCAPKLELENASSPASSAKRINHVNNGRPSLAGKKIGVVLFSNYLTDARPRRAAEILAEHGAEVEVISLRADRSEPREETVNGVRIRRVPLKRRRGGKFNYIYQYAAFTVAAMFLLTMRSFRRRYHLVHAHNMPDFLVFSALFPKMLGARIILDLHDPMPELMLTIFKLRPESFSVRMLKWLEKLSTGFADVVLTVNLASKKNLRRAQLPAGKNPRRDELAQ